MKRQIRYRTFYLTTKILVISFIIFNLFGCVNSPPKEEEYVDTLVTSAPISDTLQLDTITKVEQDTVCEIKKDTIVTEKPKIKNYKFENDEVFAVKIGDPVDSELMHKILARRKYEEQMHYKNAVRIERIEIKVDSVSDKWDEIEKTVKNLNK